MTLILINYGILYFQMKDKEKYRVDYNKYDTYKDLYSW